MDGQRMGVDNQDVLTREELVRLAGYCGKGTDMVGGRITVPMPRPKDAEPLEPGEYPPEEVWRPDLDANQRDELVAKLLDDGWEVIQSTCPGEEWQYECELNHSDAEGKPDRQSQLGVECTPGLAFCRPTLKVIGGGR